MSESASIPDPLGWRWGNTLTLDAKARLTLPEKIRQQHGLGELGGIYFVGMEEEGCLYLHTPEQHNAYLNDLSQLMGAQQSMVGLPRKMRRLMQLLVSRFQRVAADAQGRMTLPKDLLARAGIEDLKVVLVVYPHRTEIWGEDNQAAFDDEASAEGALDLLEALRTQRQQPTPVTAPVAAGDGLLGLDGATEPESNA